MMAGLPDGPGWRDWCFELAEAPKGGDRALWIAFLDEDTDQPTCSVAIAKHNNQWDKIRVYAWRHLHGPPAVPVEFLT